MPLLSEWLDTIEELEQAGRPYIIVPYQEQRWCNCPLEDLLELDAHEDDCPWASIMRDLQKVQEFIWGF